LDLLKGKMMQNLPMLNKSALGIVAKRAIVATLALSLSACGGTTSPQLWQGEEVLVEARQEVLERNVYNVSDDYRELKDRFNALERLYVDLVHQIRAQETKVATLEGHVAKVKADPEAAARLTRVRGDVSVIREQMKKLENRVFSVEMTDQQPVAARSNAPTPASTNIGSSQASLQPSSSATVPVNNNAKPKQKFYGVHLASYRSQDQVSTGWTGLTQAFGGELDGLTPLIYTQSQEGIGTFLRLIAGPLINEQEANALCGRIRQTAGEQYCRVSEYQGEPVQ
jgi:cell division septation protein DedD